VNAGLAMEQLQTQMQFSLTMTVRDVAGFLRFTPAHVRKMLATARLTGFLVGSEWRVNPQDLLVYLLDRKNRS
jgi:hypothetical protein